MKGKVQITSKIDEIVLGEEHSITQNFILWSMYDWSKQGNEWCSSTAWKESVVKHILAPYIAAEQTVLEIGCGVGFWSEALAQKAAQLHLVDIVPSCIETAKERLARYEHVEYHLTEGNSLGFLTDSSLDLVFSWNTFVHINQTDTAVYLSQIMKKLKVGGVAIIHHPAMGLTQPELGWRSDVTVNIFNSLVEKEGLTLIDQFHTWGNEQQYRLWSNLPPEKCIDVVSIVKKG